MDGQEMLCMNCFAANVSREDAHCPICGWDNTRPQVSHGLQYYTILNGRYLIGRVKLMNGEGITYSALDQAKKKMVEIKEFYPLSIAQRNSEDNTVVPFEGQENVFEEYLEQFIELSKNISRLKEVTVVHSILDIFEENYTAYAVYEFVPSVPLKKYIKQGGALPWNTVHNMFLPVLTALGLINSLGVTHLGISPETLRVTADKNLLITGFAIPATCPRRFSPAAPLSSNTRRTRYAVKPPTCTRSRPPCFSPSPAPCRRKHRTACWIRSF